MLSSIPPASPQQLLPPLIASLPASAVSPQPPSALLPLLSPILRQRVQYLSSASKEPWLPLLCYDDSKTSKLETIVKDDRFEPHPSSGEVEIDWSSEVKVRYRRVDIETLQALVSLLELELSVRLVWCIGDQEGGGDGWRVGEVIPLDPVPSFSDSELGYESIGEAEGRFKGDTVRSTISSSTDALVKPNGVDGTNGTNGYHIQEQEVEEEEDDDGSYWAQYDSTPATQTPAQNRSPAPPAMTNGHHAHQPYQSDEDAYYSQYAQVQPAMDDHDPDEALENGNVETSLGRDEITQQLRNGLDRHPDPMLSQAKQIWSGRSSQDRSPPHVNGNEALEHPRPDSSNGSTGTVERWEREAEAKGQSEIGVKQHISTSVKSLFRLARAAGIERQEFDRLVKTELDVLVLMEEE